MVTTPGTRWAERLGEISLTTVEPRPQAGSASRTSLTMKHSLIAALTITMVCAGGSKAEEKPTSGPLTPEEMATVTQYVIPPAQDIFSRLAQASKIDWKKIAAKIAKEDLQAGTKAGVPKATKAINLGFRVADAFIAVQAQDDKLLGELADVLKNLGADLKVSEPIQKRGEEARQLVKDKSWMAAGSMLATMRDEVIQGLKEKKDKDSVVLASLAGWLRGLEIVSDNLAGQYDAEGTKVLRDTALIKYLKTEVETLGAESKEHPFAKAFLAKADQIQGIVSFPKEGTMPKEDVATLSQLVSQIIASTKA
jgi:hypothetical protein